MTPNTRSIPDLVSTLSTPAVHVLKENKASLSHFGGLPNLPPTVPWPERNGKKLGFLARLSLSEIQQVCAIDWLPSSGALLFFYDIDQQPWTAFRERLLTAQNGRDIAGIDPLWFDDISDIMNEYFDDAILAERLAELAKWKTDTAGMFGRVVPRSLMTY